MKLKLWKITAMVTLPVAALIAAPLILTSCAEVKKHADPVFVYAPSDTIKAKFSEADFNIFAKGFTKTVSAKGATDIVVNLSVDILRLSAQYPAEQIEKITLTPSVEPGHVGNFRMVRIDGKTIESTKYLTRDELNTELIKYYDAGK